MNTPNREDELPEFKHDHLCQIRQQDGDDVTCTCVERQLFNMVYQWGRVGIVADWTAPAFQSTIQALIARQCTEARKQELKSLLEAAYEHECVSGVIDDVDDVWIECVDTSEIMKRIAQLNKKGEKDTTVT